MNSVAIAGDLNIQLHFIPAGFTDRLQPLDVAVFATLKSMISARLKEHLLQNPSAKIGTRVATSILAEQWKLLSQDTIANGWDQYYL